MTDPKITDEQAERLLCAIFPTRWERFLAFVRTCLYRLGERGVLGVLEDRIESWEIASRNRRAEVNLSKRRSRDYWHESK